MHIRIRVKTAHHGESTAMSNVSRRRARQDTNNETDQDTFIPPGLCLNPISYYTLLYINNKDVDHGYNGSFGNHSNRMHDCGTIE